MNTIRRRKRRKPGEKQNFYFHEGTHAAIVAYQKTSDLKEREKLYVTEIAPAFEKLVENLINIHKFTSLHDSYSDLKNDCVHFLFETLHKFDPTRGTNPFSYFNVVGKHFLIIRAKQRTLNSHRMVSIDDIEQFTQLERQTLDERDVIPSQEVLLQQFAVAGNIVDTLYEVRTAVHSDNELRCINALITIFENIDSVPIPNNKSAAMTYVREQTRLTPKQLATSMQSIKRAFERIRLKNEC